jgi:hypothetical protein
VQITYPSLDRDCLIKILRGEGHEVKELPGTPFAYLKRGDLLDWEIDPQPQFLGPEIVTMFNTIGLKIELLQAYKDKYCAENPEMQKPMLN